MQKGLGFIFFLRNTEKLEYLREFPNCRYERLHLGLFSKNNFSETNTVTFMQKVIYLKCLPTAKLLLTADGKEKIKFGMTTFHGKFYAGKLSIKF